MKVTRIVISADSLGDISANYSLGFGTFVDKPISPYANTGMLQLGGWIINYQVFNCICKPSLISNVTKTSFQFKFQSHNRSLGNGHCNAVFALFKGSIIISETSFSDYNSLKLYDILICFPQRSFRVQPFP